MNRPLLACTIIGLWLICLAPAMPIQVPAPTPVVRTDMAKAVSAPPASVDLGPSVSLSYTFPALLADSAAAYSWGYMGTSVDGGSMTDSHLTTLNTLPFSYYFRYYDVATSYTWVAMDVVTVFQGLTGVGTYNTQHDLQVVYSGITTFTWNITTWFYDITTNAWVQQDCHVGTPAGPGGTYTLLDTPSLTYTTSYIDATGDFRVKVRGWAQISAAGGGFILGNRMRMNQPRTTRTTMTETRRSSFATQGGTVLYTLAFMAPESMTTITVTYPIAWDWTSLQPNANVAETSGQIVITNTDQDTVYSASFTAPVLATANWQVHRAADFEGSWDGWSLNGSNPITTTAFNSTIVLSGGVSLYLADASGSGDLQADFGAPSTAASYWLVLSYYRVTGTVTLYWYDGATWQSLALSGTANMWTTICHAITLKAATGRAIYVRLTATASLFLDAVRLYTSSVVPGSALTGTCVHVFPEGDAAASFTNISLGLWDASFSWKGYGSAVTDESGAWSVAASSLYGSLTAQSYKLWTWVYAGSNAYWTLDAATDATTDWTETYGTSSTLTTSTDCKEGAASVYNQAKFDSDDWIRLTYDPTGTWSLTNTLLTGWVKVNSTTNVLYVYLNLYTDAAHYANYRLKYSTLWYYGFTANTWTRITVPVSTSYVSYNQGLNLASVSYLDVGLYNQTNPNTAGYGTRVDSLNFLTRSTSDTLTYPFAAPSDWSLQGSFSFNDVYGWAFVSTNYAASYTLYENDASRASGSVAKGGDNIRWTLQTTTGNVSVGIACTVPGYTGTKWLNTSYTIDLNQLTLVTFGVATSQDMVQVWLVTSWRNTTVTITDRYDDTGVTTTMFSGSAESVGSWTYDAPHEPGNHTLTVTMDGGADSLTRSLVYAWDWPLDIPDTPVLGPQVIAGLSFTAALEGGLILLLVVGLVALNRRIGGVKNLIRGTEEEAPRPRHQHTEAEEYDQAGKDYDKITREAHGT